MSDYKEFEELASRAQALRAEVEVQARESILRALLPLLQDFPGHQFSFKSTTIGPCVCVQPDIDGRDEIYRDNCDSRIGSSLDCQRSLNLRTAVNAAAAVASYVRQAFGLSIKGFAIRAEAPSAIFEGSFFRVADHGMKGVEISFLYDGSDGQAASSKWFIDQAAEQIVRKIKAGSCDDDYFRQRCGLDWNEVVSFERPTSPGL